jgi:two-component system OmpR family response regulator/two-component system response regulator QseB
VLLALLEDRPRALSRADIQARSGNRVGDGNAVEVHVHHLRRKLGESVIQTVRGVGYRIPE